MPIVWNEENIRNLDDEFLQQVISNMEKYDKPNVEVNVRFGTTGEKGVRPNYEVVVESRFPYSTITKQHKLADREQYKDTHLSAEKFSLAEIQRVANL